MKSQRFFNCFCLFSRKFNGQKEERKHMRFVLFSQNVHGGEMGFLFFTIVTKIIIFIFSSIETNVEGIVREKSDCC